MFSLRNGKWIVWFRLQPGAGFWKSELLCFLSHHDPLDHDLVLVLATQCTAHLVCLSYLTLLIQIISWLGQNSMTWVWLIRHSKSLAAFEDKNASQQSEEGSPNSKTPSNAASKCILNLLEWSWKYTSLVCIPKSWNILPPQAAHGGWKATRHVWIYWLCHILTTDIPSYDWFLKAV